MKRPNRNRKVLTGMLCLVTAAAFAACRQGGEQAASTGETFGATPVKVFEVQRNRISETYTFTGTLEAGKKINITPEIGGKIAHIFVDEGDRVVQGQVLAELETDTYRLQLKQAEAAVAVAEANSEDARRNRERMERLIRESAVSEQQVEKIRLADEAAEAQLEQARAARNLAQHALDISIMKAPFSGVIASRNAEVGDVINPMMGTYSAASGLLTLVDYSRIEITVAVSSQAAGRIAKGQDVVLRVAAQPGQEFRGKVTIVNLTADPMSKKFNVEASFDNPGLVLRPGTFGDVVFEVQSHEDTLVIPQEAVLENAYVFVAEGSKAVKKAVVLGLKNSTMIEVLDGLAEGAFVIVEGNFGLEDGAAIEVTGEVGR
jgi:RND family efflux transporter MFP subunit